MSLRSKKVIILGGSGLIGAALVAAFHERKAYILNCDIQGGDIFFDLASPKEGLDRAIDFFGMPDVFVNAAYPKDMMTHALGTIESTEIMARRMPHGSIILFSSIYGLVAPKFNLYPGTTVPSPSAAYAFVKSGILALAKYMAVKYPPVRVNVISPGGIFDNQHDLFVKRYERRVPLGRMTSVEDVVSATMFLASDAAGYVTGHNLVVDGGFSIL